ncbi:MAG TPA: hypothetical protein ENK27_02760 [Desulfobulbus sp.]|nr:hypothetical protein [Desulfobulbus sp.]
MARIIIPFPFRKHTENRREVDIEGASLSQVIEGLVHRYPGLKTINDQPALLSVFINGRQVQGKTGEWDSVPLRSDDEVSLIIPIAGG